MAFTAQASNIENYSTNASVDITLSPSDAIIEENNVRTGDSFSGTLNVSNTGSVDQYYFVSANWSPRNYSPSLTTILANTLTVSVTADPDDDEASLYTGVLNDLIDQPASPGRELTLDTGEEDVQFTITLPEDAGNIVQALDIDVDFIFVAVD
ncbi:MAG: hypothetical protein ACOCQ2_02885 [Halanaerobiales bacterium]